MPPMSDRSKSTLDHDERALRALGYRQELARRLSGFSNFALSLSIICVLAGGVTSFHLGYCATGGAAIGIGWPIVCGFAVIVALTMGRLAAAFPAAGGLYQWAGRLGGPGWGFFVAWFNLAGQTTVLAAINVGMYRFALRTCGVESETASTAGWLLDPVYQAFGVAVITASQALVNHWGIELTSRLTDFSGYWIMAVAGALAACLLIYAPALEAGRLVAFANHSGAAGGGVWPQTESVSLLFVLGFLLPAYTITGFDASAQAAEETHEASHNVPRAIVRSVVVSGLVGWLLLVALVLAAPNPAAAAAHGEGAFLAIIRDVLPPRIAMMLLLGIAIAQYLCGLATMTSASRLAYAFARDGGLPRSRAIAWVCPKRKTPVLAIWIIAIASVLFTLYTPVYSTITVVCTIFLYLSYILPSTLGAWTRGEHWTTEGLWQPPMSYRILAGIGVFGCLFLIVLGIQPPNEHAIVVVGGFAIALGAAWYAGVRKHFVGPPAVEPAVVDA